MAKRKRPVSTSQRDKSAIAAAKYLKAQGLISKQAKLHGGKYISRAVLKKTRELEWIVKNNYKAVKAPREMIERARTGGQVVVRNRLIVPKGMNAERRIRMGALPGVIPVPGGQMFTVDLPYSTMSEFLVALYDGRVDALKQRQENFAFTYFGHMSQRAFRDGKDLYQWLIKYDSITNPITGDIMSEMDQQYSHFRLYRMLPGVWNPPTYEQAQLAKKRRRFMTATQNDRRASRSRTKRIDEITVSAAEQRRAYDRERKKAERERLKLTDPLKYEAIKAAGAARSIASRNRRKGK